MSIPRLTVLVGVAACSGTPSGGTAQPTGPGPGSAPVTLVADPDGPLCAVLRANSPRSVFWAQHGCPPSPGPLAADRRPCRVQWGQDAMSLRYDASGRLAEVVGRVTTKYTYDDGGRLTTVAWASTGKEPQSIQVVHDAGHVTYKSDISEHRATVDNGQMTRFEIDDNHVCALTRDPRGDVSGVSATTNGEVTAAAKFTRDRSNLLVRRTDGVVVWNYTWDGTRLTKITGWETPVTVEYCN
jgi:YD repeat-containing protein